MPPDDYQAMWDEIIHANESKKDVLIGKFFRKLNLDKEFNTRLERFIKHEFDLPKGTKEGDSNDILQETLIALYNNLINKVDVNNFYGFVYTIARNKANDWSNKRDNQFVGLNNNKNNNNKGDILNAKITFKCFEDNLFDILEQISEKNQIYIKAWKLFNDEYSYEEIIEKLKIRLPGTKELIKRNTLIKYITRHVLIPLRRELALRCGLYSDFFTDKDLREILSLKNQKKKNKKRD